MPGIRFFAARRDLIAVLEMLYADGDIRMMESDSDPGRGVRGFRTVEEVDRACNLGTHTWEMLALWWAGITDSVRVRRIELNTGEWRETVDGGGVVRVHLGGVLTGETGRQIVWTEFSHLSEAGALRNGLERGTDWAALRRKSAKISEDGRVEMAGRWVRGGGAGAAAREAGGGAWRGGRGGAGSGGAEAGSEAGGGVGGCAEGMRGGRGEVGVDGGTDHANHRTQGRESSGRAGALQGGSRPAPRSRERCDLPPKS